MSMRIFQLNRSVVVCLFSLIVFLLPFTAAAEGEITISEAVKKFAEGGKRMRVAVFDFSNTDGARTRYDAFIADTLVTELSKYPVTLLERKKLETLLGEQALSQTGVVDSTRALKLGTLLPVDVVVSGSYTRIGTKLVINGRFIHVGTGEILSAFTSSLEAAPETAAARPVEDKQSICKKNQETVRKALYNLQDPEAVKKAVDVVLTIPFDTECGIVHFDVMYVFMRHKINDERYRRFLLATLTSLETPSDDDRAREIMRYFTSKGATSRDEWEAGLGALAKMRGHVLHIPLRYLLNGEHEKSGTIMERADAIMHLTAAGKMGRPVPVQREIMLFGILGGLQKSNGANVLAVFRKYRDVLPDDDANNKKALDALRGVYFSDNERGVRRDALTLLCEFAGSRTPTEQLAESAADFIKSVESKTDDRYEPEAEKRKQYGEDLKVMNAGLARLYCLSVGAAKNKRYHYVVEERSLYALKNGMQCGEVPAIKDLEDDMRSGEWEKKLKAAEFLSKLGEAAGPAEKTVVKYLGQQGFGGQGSRLRKFCAVTLGNIRTSDPEGISRLIASFPDYENGVSYEAEEAIGKIGIAAMPQLIDGLGNKEHAVRLRCAKALGNLGARAKKALPDLQRVAETDQDPYVRKEAQAAAQMIANDF